MKTLTIELEDTIYTRLLTAGTKGYNPEMKNPDYDPGKDGSTAMVPNTKTRDQHLANAVSQAVKSILGSYEVQEASTKAVEKKQKEIALLDINTVIT